LGMVKSPFPWQDSTRFGFARTCQLRTEDQPEEENKS